MEQLRYNWISVDSATIPTDGKSFRASLFERDASATDGSRRVTESAEGEIIRWLLSFSPARFLLVDALELPRDSLCWTEVTRPFYGPGDGDLDVVACSPSCPQSAVALECKRVKVTAHDDDRAKLNKLSELRGGAIQARNVFERFEFSRVYFTVITEVDASAERSTNVPIRGLTPSLAHDRGKNPGAILRSLIDFPGREKLRHEIGILHLEIVQPSVASIDRRVNVGACVYRQAELRAQTSKMMNMMLELAKSGR